MSARQIRRAFAAPFVVTLAGAASIASISSTACTKKPAALPHHNPPGPDGPGPHSNPPPPPDPKKDPAPIAPAPGPTADAKPVPHHDNPPPPDAIDSRPTKAREPAKYESKWTVMKVSGNADCQAYVDVNCPKPEPGKAVPTCNPPPPIKYACPDGFKDGDTLKIILRVGATECFVDRGPTKCPENAKCNPPPPRKMACPQR